MGVESRSKGRQEGVSQLCSGLDLWEPAHTRTSLPGVVTEAHMVSCPKLHGKGGTTALPDTQPCLTLTSGAQVHRPHTCST